MRYSDSANPFGAKSKRKRLLADKLRWTQTRGLGGPKPFSDTLYGYDPDLRHFSIQGSLKRTHFIFKITINLLILYLSFESTHAFNEEQISPYHQDVPIDLKSGFGRDHAALENDQSTETEQFVKQLFFDEADQISPDKIEALLVRLNDEKLKLEMDLKESAILEEVETDIFSQNKAKNRAGKLKHGQVRVTRLYSNYLIPTILKLKLLVQEGKQIEQWKGLIDDFIRGYLVFYYPNAHITRMSRNNSIKTIIKRGAIPWKFKRADSKQDEAINLIIEQENIKDLEACLQKPLNLGHYLTKQEIHELRLCKYDLSLLNPGVSGFWEKRTQEEATRYRQAPLVPFPDEDAKLLFNEIMLTGSASPKAEVKAIVQGKVRKYKVKWGREVHSDIAATNIAYLLGFNQDKMVYRPQVKIHLGKYSFEEFLSLLMAKFGVSTAYKDISSHGGPKGDEWIIIRDALIEARPIDTEVRVLPYDPTAMDLSYRREFNGVLLYRALINLADGKIANMKLLLGTPNRNHPSALDSDDRPRVLYRYQDTGYAFGPSLFVNKPQKLLYMNQKYLPNEFEEKGIVTTDKSKDEVSIRWNDFYYMKGAFEKATYSDMKWMARKIAALSGDDFEWCLVSGGMPKEIAKLYRHKLVSRKNEIIHAFELDQDPVNHYPIEPVPDLKTWNSTPEVPGDKPAVINGKVIKTHFNGKQVYTINQNTVPYFLLGLVNQAAGSLIGLAGNGASLGYSRTEGTQDSILFKPQIGAPGLANLTSNLGAQNSSDFSPLPGFPVNFTLGVGISASLLRYVAISSFDFHSNYDQLARPYMIKDSLVLSVGVNSPLLQKFTTWLPINLQAAVRLFEVRYEFVHFSENLFDGYTNSFIPFFRAIGSPLNEAAKNLDRMEVIQRSYAMGFEGGVSLGMFNFDPIIKNYGGGSGGLVKLDNTAYTRDQYGQLHAYFQNTKEAYRGIDLTLGQFVNPAITRFLALGYQNTKLKYHTVQKDYVARQPDLAFSQDTPILDNDGRLLSDLKLIKNQNTEDLKDFELNFNMESKGVISSRERIAFLKGRSKQKRNTQTSIDFNNGHQKKLLLHRTQRQKYTGISTEHVFFKQQDLTVKNARRVTINVEMDEFNPEGFTVVLKELYFFRHGKRKEVLNLINDINLRFSESDKTPFYRDYELPSETEIDNYRKIYGVTRVYLSGYKLLETLESLDPEAFKKMAERYFAQFHQPNLGLFKRLAQSFKTSRRVSNLMPHFKRLKQESSFFQRDYERMLPLIDKFVYHMKIHKFGINLLRDLLDLESIFVVGDIQGVFSSFSTANDLQQRQRRHFAGKHWGNLNLIPPVQYHNKYDRILFPSTYVTDPITQNGIFGPVPDGRPEEVCDPVQ